MKKFKYWLIFGAAFLTLFIWSQTPLFYLLGSIEGVVVDMDSREPVEGAVVQMTWGGQEGFFVRTHVSKAFLQQEVVTDYSGTFRFSGGVVYGELFSSRRLIPYGPRVGVSASGYKTAGGYVAHLAGRHLKSFSKKGGQTFMLVGEEVESFENISIEIRRENME